MALADLSDWLDEYTRDGCLWYAKRLSANDTLANGTHQAGPYIPTAILHRALPDLNRPDVYNPEVRFSLSIDSHCDCREVRAVWYNGKLSKYSKHLKHSTRNEARLTNFGGQSSPLLDPENTGALALFIFVLSPPEGEPECHVWVCDQEAQDDLVEERIGIVGPGKWRVWMVGQPFQPDLFASLTPVRKSCRLESDEIPAAWRIKFPDDAEIVQKIVEMRPPHAMSADERLLRRYKCEDELFQSIEHALGAPVVQSGFRLAEEFLVRAQTILPRRKVRSGRSLELQARVIFQEEGLAEDVDFSSQPETEPGKKPDFLFPSQGCYRDPFFPANRLRMLAVKTTCRDRWRQVLNEAERIPVKHLLTLQEGVSENQFREMTAAGIRLVVPDARRRSYPESIRPHLQTLESFIGDVRLLRRG